MCDECEDYGLAADLLSFSPVSKRYLPEKYFSMLEKGWNSSIASYTGDNSIEKCINEVKKYACFPGSHICFGMALTDPLPTKVQPHHNLKNNEKYIYKQDIMIVLHHTVKYLKCDHGYDLLVQQKLFVNSVIGFFLKSIGFFFLQGNFELVPCPETLRLKFSEQLEEKLENTKSIHKLTDKISCNEIIEKLEKILLLNKKSPESESLLKIVEHCGVQPSNLEFFERCLDRTSVIIAEINRFMNSNKKLALPGKVGSNFVPTVRVFDDGNDGQFVLVHELLREMFVDRNNDEFEFVHGILKETMNAKLGTFGIEAQADMPELWTEDFEAIQHILGDDSDKITFVLCKIVDNSRRAHFVPSINGKYCFQITNFILEIFGDLITVHGYFQNLNTTHWDMLTPLFHELANRLERELKGCELIETQAALEIKRWMLDETAKVFACRPKKTKEIRAIRDDWFTVRDVRNELKRLGITESFAPGIHSDLINNAHDLVTDTSHGCMPPTTCFYKVLEMIQVALVLKKFEKIWHLFHICDDCNCVLPDCIFCDGSASFPKSRSQTLANEKAEKRKEKKKRQAEKKRLAKEEQKDAQEVVPEHDSDDIQVEQVAPADLVPEVVKSSPAAPALTSVSVAPGSDLTSKATQQQPIPDHAISQETVSEGVNQPRIEQKNVSNSCSKCYRTSQHCEKVKTQLKEEKIKTKALKKEIAQLSETVVKKDETISEKDEEIRLLKEKLAAMEASLQQSGAISVNEPSTSSQAEDEDEGEQPVRYLTPTYKNSEFSVETRAKFNELLNIRDSHTRLERQAKQRARALTNKSKDFGIKRMASRELFQILKSYGAYFQVVEDNIKWIQKHKNNHLDKLTTLPELPKFSENFETTYDEVVNEELSDKQCPVCIEEITDLSGTIKCHCKKRYHLHCAWDMDVKGYKCYCKERLPLD
ncbi:hypothetical protein CAEBREN_22156 [Caenorhabditis brenneri]|uniref:DUF7809 domain-containing protein n=1 Tax=Caenorhabditis brenneri TaxID=135651 RepID=G0P0F5_CAEBE|nr:hypothetical protein CAEBREN_22156 [Caenorhabditis brenneri]